MTPLSTREGDLEPTEIETTVPPDETPATHCPYCGRPFPTEQLSTLHIGDVHQTEWTGTEHEAYEDVYQTESDELFIYHLKVIAALVFVFFGFSYVYVFVWI
ncbi:HNH endonuclease [Halocatena marina]|uniref:HNH endonuclease n=1 Tax=Halocatena marina TaxID=2934937 RepID=UPI00200D5F09|nr:HNH endonuclease [Halocatena marina]